MRTSTIGAVACTWFVLAANWASGQTSPTPAGREGGARQAGCRKTGGCTETRRRKAGGGKTGRRAEGVGG